MDILEQPNRIYHCDETGFPMAPHPTKVITSKGNPHVYQQGASKKAQITMLLTAGATTHYIAPLWSFQGRFSNNIYQGVLQNFPRGSVWTLTLQVDGSGLVLQLARAKLHPKNPMTSCAEVSSATD